MKTFYVIAFRLAIITGFIKSKENVCSDRHCPQTFYYTFWGLDYRFQISHKI